MKNFLILSFACIGLAFAPHHTWHEILSEEIDALHATNKYRLSKKRTELEMDTFLCVLAREHSENMANGKVRFGHHGFDKRAKKIQLTLHSSAQAENVFMSSEEAGGEEAVKNWIASKGHRKNMLGKEYKKIGIGMATGKKGTFYTQIFSD